LFRFAKAGDQDRRSEGYGIILDANYMYAILDPGCLRFGAGASDNSAGDDTAGWEGIRLDAAEQRGRGFDQSQSGRPHER
jgi:hypothetical protein